jgi:hypothetical protein
MTFLGLPWPIETVINAAVLFFLWLFVVFYVTIPALSRFMDRRTAKIKDEYRIMLDEYKADLLAEIEQKVGNAGDIWAKSGFFPEEQARLIGQPVEYEVTDEKGVVSRKVDGVWSPYRILRESIKADAAEAVAVGMMHPEVDKLLNAKIQNAATRITEKFGDNVVEGARVEQSILATLAESGDLPEGTQLEQLYASNPDFFDRLLEGVADKMGWAETTGNEVAQVVMAARRMKLLEWLQGKGGSAPAPRSVRPRGRQGARIG